MKFGFIRCHKKNLTYCFVGPVLTTYRVMMNNPNLTEDDLEDAVCDGSVSYAVGDSADSPFVDVSMMV